MSFRVPMVRSLYWRIALACLALLLAGLVVQTVLFVTALASGGGLPARRAAQRLAEVVAGDVGRALEQQPRTPIPRLLRRYRALYRPVLFVTPDGLVIGGPRRGAPSTAVLRGHLRRQRPTDGAAPIGVAPVRVGGRAIGRIVVLPSRPWLAVAREIGPLTVAGGVLCATGGAALVAWFTFGPAHRRLRALEDAAARLGRGDLAARAPETGADEITAVSRAFNHTAGALAAQIDRVTQEQAVRRQLLADVSHELHTPLTAIRGYIETLGMRELPLTDADRARYLAIVDDEAVRLERLIGDLLDLARVETGGLVLRQDTVPVQSLWDRVRDRHAPSAEAAGVQLVLVDTPMAISGDAGRLEQALSNLVANGIRFTPAGGRITLTASRDATDVRLEVCDTGAGLRPEDQARVFDRFYKQDVSRSGSGTGLGLSIVRAIAEAHGGSVSVTSAPGAGTTFSIVLPRHTERSAPNAER